MPEMARYPVRLQRWTLKRLDDAYKAFFRRVKIRSGTAGFPRFRGKDWWNSFGFDEFHGIRFDGKRLRFLGLSGGLRVHLHRLLPKDVDIRSCVINRDGKGWNISFQIAVETPAKITVASAVGIDLGLKVFVYQSDDVIIPSPRIARRAERGMRRGQRALARCRQGSKRRRKVRARVISLNRKIADARATWLHRQSARIIANYDLVAVEDLSVKNMVQHSTLARPIMDASWSKFLDFLTYKAEKAGKHLIRVDPRMTTQECSGCGAIVRKGLADRVHNCSHCGLILDRDHNAALNILHRGVVAAGLGNVARWGERRAGKLSPVSN